MTYWTLSPVDDCRDMLTQTITLCEHHALDETNAAMRMADVGEAFGSMIEAYAVLSALMAMGSGDLGMTSSEIGTCEVCEHEKTCECEESA